jgi:hypothetical protein
MLTHEKQKLLISFRFEMRSPVLKKQRTLIRSLNDPQNIENHAFVILIRTNILLVSSTTLSSVIITKTEYSARAFAVLTRY